MSRNNNFIPVTRAYAIVKEELKSYFYTNAVDDSLFDSWTRFAMSRFQVSTLPIKSTFLHVENYMVDLPEDFHKAKEVWLCGISYRAEVPDGSYTYYQKDCRVTSIDDRCHECFEEDVCTHTDPKYRVTHKITGSTLYEYRTSTLLRPGDHVTKDYCGNYAKGPGRGKFFIEGKKFILESVQGDIHLVYYTENVDEDGTYLIVDDPKVEMYLIKYLKARVLEMVSNSTTDETFNQIERKLMFARQEEATALLDAETSLKKNSKYDVADLISRRRRRFSNYRRSLK